MIADVGLLGNITDRNPVTLATADWQDSTHIPLAPFDWVILNLAGSDKDWKIERTDQLLTQRATNWWTRRARWCCCAGSSRTSCRRIRQ